MFKNYLLMTIRSVQRQKVSSLIAILGLALGISCSILLFIYIDYQFSYEDFMPKDSEVKRLVSRTLDNYSYESYNGYSSVNAYTAEVIKENASSIKDMAKLTWSGDMTLLIDNEFYNQDLVFVDNNFFDIIPFKVLSGNIKDFFYNPNAIVLDQYLAKKYFPEGDVIGKEIVLNHGNKDIYTVSAVVEIPDNTSLKLENNQAFLSINTIIKLIEANGEDYWSPTSNSSSAVFIVPVDNFDNGILINELNSVINYLPKDNESKIIEFQIEDFKDIHLFTKDISSFNFLRPVIVIVFLIIITVSILFISIVNCISILIAQSINRTKEVGVRVVMGSTKKDLIYQFLTESIILSFMSLIIGLVLSELLLPGFSSMVFTNLKINYSPVFILYLIVLTTVVGILSGLYPAFYLSSLKVVESLKGKSLLKLGKFRKLLVVSQFIFASITLICSLILNNEIKFIQNIDIGFNRDNIVHVYTGYDLDKEPYSKLLDLNKELKRIDGVEAITYSDATPFFGGGGSNVNEYSPDNGVTYYQEVYSYIDLDYLNVLGIKPIEGEIKYNTVVVMKSVLNYRNLKIGDIISLEGKDYRVGSFIDDYYLESPIYGTDFGAKFHIITDSGFYFQMIRFKDSINIEEVKNTWRKFYPNRSFEYRFMNSCIEDSLNPEILKTLKMVLNLAMYISLFISALGLFGLVLHSIKQKNKEISIRKVLGADYFTIIKQFMSESLLLIFIGVLIGVPLGIILISNGLYSLDYPYVIHDTFKTSMISGLSITIIGTLFILLMVTKCALEKPSKALRYE